MSYDLQIYTCCEPITELARLATEEGFERNNNYFLFRGKNGQVIFHPADKVEAEDIPVSVFRELPGIGYLVLASIEGAASVSDRKRAIRLAKNLARATRGVLVNPQEDTIETARGLKRVDLADLVKSWWWNGIPSALDLAAMIGPPYDKLWPDFIAAGTKVSSNLFYIETIAERKPLLIIAPSDIVQPKMPDLPRTITAAELPAYDKLTAMRFPSVWPFCAPFEKRQINPLSHPMA